MVLVLLMVVFIVKFVAVVMRVMSVFEGKKTHLKAAQTHNVSLKCFLVGNVCNLSVVGLYHTRSLL